MDCEQVREALSARIDGEDAGVAAEWLDGHLTDCPGCARWRDQAQQITREVRLQSLRVPDLTAQVLAAVAADQPPQRQRQPRVAVLRIAVAIAALAQLALALPMVVGADEHAGREIAAFEVALAVGFALGAWRPQWARPLVPVAVVLAAGLMVTSLIDITSAQTTMMHETGHAAAAVQAALLWVLARQVIGGLPQRPATATAAPA